MQEERNRKHHHTAQHQTGVHNGWLGRKVWMTPLAVPIRAAGDKDKGPKKGGKRQEGVQVLERIRTKKPNLYRVILYNDDYTTQEFVVHILAAFFRKDGTEAMQIMLKAHMTGRAIVGVYTKDVAETKVTQATDYAKEQGHPLMLSYEPDS